jgi:hypothetical protein
MSAAYDFYVTRAEDCARDAGATGLPNVRDRCLRSEAVWRDLASRQLRGDALRDSRDAMKAAALCA